MSHCLRKYPSYEGMPPTCTCSWFQSEPLTSSSFCNSDQHAAHCTSAPETLYEDELSQPTITVMFGIPRRADSRRRQRSIRQPGVEAITMSRWYLSNRSVYRPGVGVNRLCIRIKNLRAKEKFRRSRIISAEGSHIPKRNFQPFSAQTSQMWLSMASVLMRREPPTRRR